VLLDQKKKAGGAPTSRQIEPRDVTSHHVSEPIAIAASRKRHDSCTQNTNTTIVSTNACFYEQLCAFPFALLVYVRQSVVYHPTCGRDSESLAEPAAPHGVQSSLEDTTLVLAQLPTPDTVALSAASPCRSGLRNAAIDGTPILTTSCITPPRVRSRNFFSSSPFTHGLNPSSVFTFNFSVKKPVAL